jgi:glycosyltransferase involved in cell wall biosynthesis
VIIADGGSTDGTAELAEEAGSLVVTAAKGRGNQIRAGVAATTASAVLVLHADAMAPPKAASQVRDALNANPCAAGGAFAMRFTTASPGMTVLTWLNNLRARLSGMSFGDQGQFFRKQALGEFPDLPLMEDVETGLRLVRAGGTVFLDGPVRVSGRRWSGPGGVAKVVLVLRLLAGYLVRRRLWGSVDAHGAYRAYYGRGGPEKG